MPRADYTDVINAMCVASKSCERGHAIVIEQLAQTRELHRR